MDCIRTMTQCMFLHVSDQGFSNRDVQFPLTGGEWEILLGEFCLIYMIVETWGKVILTIWTFLKGKSSIL